MPSTRAELLLLLLLLLLPTSRLSGLWPITKSSQAHQMVKGRSMCKTKTNLRQTDTKHSVQLNDKLKLEQKQNIIIVAHIQLRPAQ